MGNTYTGTINPTLAVVLQSDQVFPDNDNIQGTLVEIDELPDGKSVDNIFYFDSATENKYYRRVIDGPVRAAHCGIYPGTVDMADRIEYAFAHEDIWEIVFDHSDSSFDYPNTIDITVNKSISIPYGKVLTFKTGNRLVKGDSTDPVVITGGIINAPYNADIFDRNLIIKPSGLTGDKFSVKWFGAKGNDINNDQPAIQKAIDTVIANNEMLNRVYIPNGTYKCDSALILEKFNGTSYIPHTVFLEGENSWWGFTGTGTILKFTRKDQFGIGVQLGKGAKIKNIKLEGRFTPPAATGYDWFKLDFSEFTDPTCRDTQYSPYSAIVIDPFSRTGSLPTDRYQDLDIYYTQDDSNDSGGSTGIEMEDIWITNWVIGFICSPNGHTVNAEQIRWTKIQFAKVKAAFVNCSAQEKVNVIDMVGCWDDVHTVFHKGSYGVATAGVYKVSNLNLAGRVNQIFLDGQGGYFASHFDHLFSESLGKFGYLESALGSSVSNCELGFALPQELTGALPNWLFEGGGITFNNCNIRYYGQKFPITINGAFTFNNCVFGSLPYFGNYTNLQPGDRYNTFLNCFVFGSQDVGGFGVRTAPQFLQPQSFLGWMGGKYTVTDPVNDFNEIRVDYIVDEELPYVLLETSTTFQINISGTREATITVGSGDIDIFKQDRALMVTMGANQVLLGIVKTVVGNSVTIAYIPKQIVSGTSYQLWVMHPIKTLGLVGNVTNGSNVISNVDFDNGITNGNDLIGKVIRSRMINGIGPGGAYAIITAGTSNSLTIHKNFTVDCSNVSLSFHKKYIRFKSRTGNSINSLLLNGDIIEVYNTRSDQGMAPNKLLVVEAGYMYPLSIGKTRKAITPSLEPYRGLSIKRSTSTTVIPTLGIDIYEVDTSAGDVNFNLPYTDFVVRASGNTKVIKVIKITGDDNVVYINKNTVIEDQPISGQSTITLVNQYDEVEINIAVILFELSPISYIASVTINQ